MRYFDTHAHIELIFDDPIEQLLVCQQAKQTGASRIVSISNSLIDFFSCNGQGRDREEWREEFIFHHADPF